MRYSTWCFHQCLKAHFLQLESQVQVSVSLYINCDLRKNTEQNSVRLSFLTFETGVKIVLPPGNCTAWSEFVHVKCLKTVSGACYGLPIFANFVVVDKNKWTNIGYFGNVWRSKGEWSGKWWAGTLKIKWYRWDSFCFYQEHGDVLRVRQWNLKARAAWHAVRHCD